MADLINKRFVKGLSDEKLNERIDFYARPENCENLQVPTVNPEVWKVLPLAARKADLKMVTIQTAIVKAATAVAQSTNAVPDTKSVLLH